MAVSKSAISLDPDSLPESDALSRHTLNSLVTQAADAVDDIGALFKAYRCLETLLVPHGPSVEPRAVPDEELYALLAALNHPMRKRIRQAQRANARLKARLCKRRAAPRD